LGFSRRKARTIKSAAAVGEKRERVAAEKALDAKLRALVIKAVFA
jgi:hypothetical protein